MSVSLTWHQRGPGGTVQVRAHAAAAVGNLASHPLGAVGEASLQGTFRRPLLDGGMFENVLTAAARPRCSSGDNATAGAYTRPLFGST